MNLTLQLEMLTEEGTRSSKKKNKRTSSYLTEHYNLVCVDNCGKPVGDEHWRPVLHHVLHWTQDVLGAHKDKLFNHSVALDKSIP